MRGLAVFVGGIHGSGKTSLCQKLAPRVGAYHATASSIIAETKQLEHNKAISGIVDNQKILIAGFRKLVKQHSLLLLDGHFCLLNKSGQIENLPINVFKKLLIKKIIVAQLSPTQIHERLLNRDGSTHQLTVSDITSFQQLEIKHAHLVANSLNLPIIHMDTSTQTNFLDAAEDFIKKTIERQS